jgi:cysteinyl-tRNA synthetase
MIAGARVDVAPYKRGDMDFVLWKPSKDSEPGWESPWGRGRPGWHIECSAMSWKHLGEVFDIHGGGIDLVFPHHENEIAQTRCAFGHDVMANVWMHNGFLQVEGEKMSKSLGNFVTIHELLNTERFGGRKWPGEVLRLAMLRTHYRQPIDFTVKALEEAEKILDMWYKAIEKVGPCDAPTVSPDVVYALADDLNTHHAISYLHSMFQGAIGFRAAGLMIFADEGAPSLALLVGSARLVGLLQHDPIEWKQRKIDDLELDVLKVIDLISTRNAARAAKNWAESDRVRDELAAIGVALKDNKDGTTTWEVKR